MKIAEIKERLVRFVSSDEADQIVNEAIKINRLGKKEQYDAQEIDVILDHLLSLGGFIEFVARLLKSKLLMEEDQKVTEDKEVENAGF